MQSIRNALGHGSSHQQQLAEQVQIRFGELSLASSLPASLTSSGKFAPYMSVMRNDEVRSRHKTGTNKSGWNTATSSFNAMTFNDSFTIDVNCASDHLTLELWDDNMLKDTLVATGVFSLASLNAGPAGAGSGPQTVPLTLSDRFKDASAGASIGSIQIFASISATRPISAGGAGAGTGATTSTDAHGATTHGDKKVETAPSATANYLGTALEGALGAIGLGNLARRSSKSHEVAGAAPPGAIVDPTMSTATTGGVPLATNVALGPGVGDADALGDAVSGRHTTGPTYASGGTANLPGQAIYDFQIRGADIDYTNIERTSTFKRDVIQRDANPYIILRVNDNKSTAQKTTALREFGTTGLRWNEVLRIFTNPTDKLHVFLADDRVFKNTFIGHRVLSLSEIQALATNTSVQSIPLYEYDAKCDTAGSKHHHHTKDEKREACADGSCADSSATCSDGTCASNTCASKLVTANLMMLVAVADATHVGAPAVTDSLLIGAGQASHIGTGVAVQPQQQQHAGVTSFQGGASSASGFQQGGAMRDMPRNAEVIESKHTLPQPTSAAPPVSLSEPKLAAGMPGAMAPEMMKTTSQVQSATSQGVSGVTTFTSGGTVVGTGGDASSVHHVAR